MPIPDSIATYLRLCARAHKRKYVVMSVMLCIVFRCPSCFGGVFSERHITCVAFGPCGTESTVQPLPQRSAPHD